MMHLSDRLRSARCPSASAVVVAAGAGARFGGDKLRADLCGAPVLIRTLRALESSSLVREIVLVAHPDRVEETAAFCRGCGLSRLSRVVPGGETRTRSCFAGVMAASDRAEILAIHDGARPLVTGGVIDAAIWAAYRHGAAAPALPVKDTVKLAADHIVASTPDRASLFAVQTPQCFQRDIIRGALLRALEQGWELTDDCMAVERIGGSVWLTEGSEENIKITTPFDLTLAAAIWEGRQDP